MSYEELDNRHGGASFLVGFIAGSVLGAGLALMFAPKPGAETRREVADRAQQLSKRAADEYDTASKRVTHLAERGRDAYRSAADRARDLAERGRQEADKLASRARKAGHEAGEQVEAGAAAAGADVRDISERRS